MLRVAHAIFYGNHLCSGYDSDAVRGDLNILQFRNFIVLPVDFFGGARAAKGGQTTLERPN